MVQTDRSIWILLRASSPYGTGRAAAVYIAGITAAGGPRLQNSFAKGNFAMSILYSNYASDLSSHSSHVVGNVAIP